jgi:hypothetical protein
MDDEEIRLLLQQSGNARRGLLETQLQSLVIAGEIAEVQLALGNTAIAVKEIDAAEKGADTIESFTARLPAEQRTNLMAGLASLKVMLAGIKERLPTRPA